MFRRLLLAAALLVSAPAGAQSEAQLQMVCKQFIERVLPDPREANLEWTNAQTAKRKDGLYRVVMMGRVKNVYGALAWAKFECVIRYDGDDNFRAVSVKYL
jgi:hypothetical protein